MYSWSGDTTNWRGAGAYKFDKNPYKADPRAKKARTYSSSSTPNMKMVDPKDKEIESYSANPILVGVDVTGSMASWPGEIFDRLPLFATTLAQYRDDAEFCFAAIGDATCDSYPLQVNKFGKGIDLEDHIKALGAEGGGGGQIKESYELFGYYMLNNVKTPNALSPFLFILGDEMFYPAVNPDQVEHYIGSTLQSGIDSLGLWAALSQKYNMFFLQKPYGHGGEASVDAEVRKAWEKALGKERVIQLPSMERTVDIMMGIVAKSWGKYDDFSLSLGARQPDDEQTKVHMSIRYLPDGTTEHSVMDAKGSTKTKSLLDLGSK
ncbi:TPA: hypothetical protein HA239_05655 [Candidatus Woesearchaeota archaeon]|nr:hypothetical protein QT06_C0001G1237 [archaeon GW2011_AR15]MBS3104298.1 hypothetical protein [Candidatus Woesearchaeota archaeon]HIH41864.1 hypothetical protein [Candidatus Woesearchaeota archaeon]